MKGKQHLIHNGDTQTKIRGQLSGGEQGMGTGVAINEIADRFGLRLQKCSGQIVRQYNGQCIAQAGCIFNDCPALFTGKGDRNHSLRGRKLRHGFRDLLAVATETCRNTGNRERAKIAQQIDNAFGVLRLIAGINALQFLFNLLNDVRCQ